MNDLAEAEIDRLKEAYLSKKDALREAMQWAYKDAARVCRSQFEREPYASIAEVCAGAICERSK